MTLNKWTWLGLAIVAVGWMILLCGCLAPTFIPEIGPVVSWPVLSGVAACAIFSGFAVAILAALIQGFGALDSFFVAALERSAARAEAPPMMVEPEPEPAAHRVVDRGFKEKNAYRVFGDGSVEVETMLGSRRFASLEEAQGFVGAR